MKRKVKYSSILVFFGLLCITLITNPPIASAAQQKAIELKYGDVVPPFAHGAKYGIVPWLKRVEQATKGQVKITLYHAQSLFKAKETVTAVESGLADMALINLGYFAGRFNLIEVVNLPFLVPNTSTAVQARIAAELYEALPDIQKEFSSMKMLFLVHGGSYFFTTKKKPIRMMDDLKGLKIRTIGRWPARAVKDFGATPVMLPMPQLYEAASKGIIDGALVFQPMALDLKLPEVFNYWTDAPIYSALSAIVMNLDRWNALPQDVKQAMIDMGGIKGAVLVSEQGFGWNVKDKVAAMAKKEGYEWQRAVVDKEELEKWKKIIGKPIWKEWVKEMEKKGLPGQKVLDKALQLVEKYK